MDAGTSTLDTRAADLVVAELLTTAGFGDPYTRIERVRALGRAVPSTLGVLVTGYDDCQQALRNPSLGSDAHLSFAPLLGDRWRENRALSLLADSLLFLEGDAHNRVRKLVAAAFTPRAVAEWQPTIDEIAETLLGDVVRRMDAGEEVDLVESLARPLPIAVMAELLGLPRADATRLRTMVGEIAEVFGGLVVDDDGLQRAHEAGEALDRYLRDSLGASSAAGAGAPSVLGRIALDTASVITDDDRVALAFVVLAAGFETTAMLVANALSLLLENRESWERLAEDASFATAVVEETLRLQTPAAFTTRVASTPTQVAGIEVEPGATVTLFLAGANRDPAKYLRPASFEPERFVTGDGAAVEAVTAPLSFGSGLHHCLGSVLARTEAVAVLSRLGVLGRVDQLRLVRPIEWRPSVALRGVEAFVVARRDNGHGNADGTDTASPSASADGPGGHMATGLRRRFVTTGLSVRVGAGYGASRVRRALARGDRKTEIADDFAASTAARAAEVLGDLKGVTMKMGQILSFAAVGMPEVAQRSFAALQSDAPPMPEGDAEAAVERAFRRPVSKLFAEWNPRPIAAASIGQVHRARLHDGRDVAVKVQYPGVANAIETDLVDQARFAKLLGRVAMRGFDADTFARELRLRILEEIDYTNEAEQQRTFAERFADHPVFRVPKVIPEFSNRVVLTSDWAQGERWTAFMDHADQVERDRVGEILARFSFAGTRRYRHFNADPNPGNYLVDPHARFVTFLDFGLAKRVSVEQDRSLWLLVDSMLDHRSPDEVVAGSIEGGYLKPEHGLDAELLLRFFYLTGDFYERHPFTVTTDWFRDVAQQSFMFAGEFAPIRNKLNTQADFFLRDRVHWGLLSILAQLNATADWGAINEEYRSNADPCTEIGEAEAAWIRDRAGYVRGAVNR